MRRRAGIDQRAGYEARRQRTEILIRDAVCFREQRRVAGRASAERIEPGREMPVAPDGLSEVHGADDLLKRQPRRRLERFLAWRRPGLEQRPGLGIDRRRVLSVHRSNASSTYPRLRPENSCHGPIP